jgi:potassium-transporting ATPase KdpC subunit
MRPLLRQLRPAVVAVAVFTVLCGLVYPLAITGVAQVVFPGASDGSLVRRDDEVVGSRLIGQAFASPLYFHSRPSAAGDGYDASTSSGANLGPTNPDLIDTVSERAEAYRTTNGLGPGTPVPVDAVTASASGLDPHISVANAHLQATRIADERGLSRTEVDAIIDAATDDRVLGVLGDPGVNVLAANLALDELGR